MTKEFIKMHGLGNDFAIFDGRVERLDLTPVDILYLGDRHRGIGFDQMVVIDPPKSAEAAAFMRIYNADGSEVGACGNVTRCVAKLLMDEEGVDKIALETKNGLLKAEKLGNKIKVDMSKVKLKWQEIPLSHEEDTLSLPMEAGELTNPVAVNVGNPHAVFFVDDVEKVDIAELGPQIEHHQLFPEKINVEIAQVLTPNKIRMRVWERGTGITEACGTGACATAVAAIRRGLIEGRKATIILDGGELDIEWRESDAHVLMTGDVTEVYRGEIKLP